MSCSVCCFDYLVSLEFKLINNAQVDSFFCFVNIVLFKLLILLVKFYLKNCNSKTGHLPWF